MPFLRHGEVVSITTRERDLIEAVVRVADEEVAAAGYPRMLGDLRVGDRVVVNTTGIELGLGTGGVAFILWNLDGDGPPAASEGHIVKLRYTPWQMDVAAVEAQESPLHERLRDARSIEPMVVVACGLHSQIAGVAAGVKATSPPARIGYLMTDAGALPLAWSRLVRALRETELIDVTCTAGNAFGGDMEAVNVFSGLVALREAGVQVAIAGMGPGSVGTGTALGFSGIEQAQLLDAASSLGATAIACPRISFADPRERQRGISHHTRTSLSLAARPCVVALPGSDPDLGSDIDFLQEQRGASGAARHDVRIDPDAGRRGVALLADKGIRPTTMGRSIDEDPDAFQAAAAAGAVAASYL